MDGETRGGGGEGTPVRVRQHGPVVAVARTNRDAHPMGVDRRSTVGALIDDAFAGTTDASPGPVDGLLAIAGATVTAWAWLGAAGGPWLALGLALLALGAAVPVSHIVRGAANRPSRHAEPVEATDAGH